MSGFKPDFGKPKQEKPKPKRSNRFDAPKANKTAVRSVTNQPPETQKQPGKKAINYKRKTIELYVNQIDYIKRIAAQDHMGLMAMYRWLLDQGLQNYDEGIRPIPAKPTTKRVGEAPPPERKLKAITMTPKQISQVADIAQGERLGVMAAYRWLIDQGLQNHERDERPLDQLPDHDVELGHWTSNDREF